MLYHIEEILNVHTCPSELNSNNVPDLVFYIKEKLRSYDRKTNVGTWLCMN